MVEGVHPLGGRNIEKLLQSMYNESLCYPLSYLLQPRTTFSNRLGFDSNFKIFATKLTNYIEPMEA